MDGDKQEDNRNYLPIFGYVPKSFWIRHISLQADSINQRLLEYNVRIICICCPILYVVLYFL